MSRRKLAVAAGALILIGGAAAIAAVGSRDGRMGHRERFQGMDDLAQMTGPSGPGDDRRGGRSRRDAGPDAGGGQDMRRGWFSRSVTAEEFEARTRERFARLDKNSDGVIDAAEIEGDINTRTDGRGPLRDSMQRRFEGRMDANRDGKVTRQEVLDRVKRDFARMDLDGDGRITDMDLPPALRGRDVLKGGAGPMMGGPRRGPMGGPMGGSGGMEIGPMGGLGRLIAADANKDGIISLDEVLAEAGRRFDLADRNKDGVIDNADRDALHKETTDYRVRRFLHSNGAGKEGRLTREQFFAAAKQRFAERDMNNDGRIDRQDFGPGGGPGRGPGMKGPGPGPQGPGPQGPGGPDRGPPPR